MKSTFPPGPAAVRTGRRAPQIGQTHDRVLPTVQDQQRAVDAIRLMGRDPVEVAWIASRSLVPGIAAACSAKVRNRRGAAGAPLTHAAV
ncbi:hypothetical protein AB0L13_34565 [Saccharopolyspora shandongensis]|uniref:hypothetical protein n=1 Tax=Saccharopolyspora shandongensis TaxID=418495 RepID=UPI0034148DBA